MFFCPNGLLDAVRPNTAVDVPPLLGTDPKNLLLWPNELLLDAVCPKRPVDVPPLFDPKRLPLWSNTLPPNTPVDVPPLYGADPNRLLLWPDELPPDTPANIPPLLGAVPKILLLRPNVYWDPDEPVDDTFGLILCPNPTGDPKPLADEPIEAVKKTEAYVNCLIMTVNCSENHKQTV